MSRHVLPPTGEEPLLLRPKEAARTLAISPRSLWTLTNCGQIPCVRFGRAVRYRRQTLEELLAKREGNRR